MRIRLVLCAAVFCAVTAAAFAETVELADGRVFEGEFIDETAEFVTIREAAGDSSIDAVYEKSEVKSIGGRLIGEEVQQAACSAGAKTSAPGRAVKPAIDFESRERADYEKAVRDIVDEVRRLNGLWNADCHDYAGFRQWFGLFSSRSGAFREKYGNGAKVVSYSMMDMVFRELEHFRELVQDMEKVSRSYDKSVAVNASDSWRQRFQGCLNEDERLARESLRKAGDYAALAREKICRR